MGVLKLTRSIFIAASALTVSARLGTITEHQSACSATSTRLWPSCTPTNAVDTCGFDARRDKQVGTVDLSDPDVRPKYYDSSSNQWLVDDMPYFGSHEMKHKRFSLEGTWDDVTSYVSNNALPAAKWAGGVVVGAVAKAGLGKVYNGVQTWWSGGTSSAGGDTVTTLSDIQSAAINPSEVISDASSLFADASVEDVLFAVVALKHRKRDGTNCTSSSCSGAMFSSFSTYDGLVSLYHALDGSIYSFNATNVLSEATKYAAGLFSGVENSLFGDSRGRILHAYEDEIAAHGVSRLRLSDVNSLPKTSMLINLVTALPSNQTSGTPRLTAVDIKGGKGYHLITCTYPNTFAKVFIGNDFELGPVSLVQRAASDLVQALDPNWCASVPYTFTAG